jgi:hypothetical protein
LGVWDDQNSTDDCYDSHLMGFLTSPDLFRLSLVSRLHEGVVHQEASRRKKASKLARARRKYI